MRDSLADILTLLLMISAVIVKLSHLLYHGRELEVLSAYFLLYMLAIVSASLTFWRKAWILFVSGIGIGFLSELIGTRIGLPFGHYYYQELRPQVAGVALFVPVAWGTYLFLSYLTASSMFEGVKASLMASFLMVILDLAMDPLMTSWKAWVWVTKTELSWYGVPLTNYAGWFLVSLVFILLYRYLSGKEEFTHVRAVNLMPFPYLLEMLAFHILAPPETEEPTFYALIIALLALTAGLLAKVFKEEIRRLLEKSQGELISYPDPRVEVGMYEISQREYELRRERVREELERRNLDALILFSPLRIFYLTGYHMLSTERPLALILPRGKSPIFYVPRLEEDHVKYRVPWAEEIRSYFEYPGEEHPMKGLVRVLKEEGISRIGVDSDGYQGAYGYKGPTLSELLGREVEKVPEIVDEMRLIKSEGEILLLKESAKWCALALRYLQEYSLPGTSEIEASLLASLDASSAMIRAIGPATFAWIPPAKAYFRGQVGELSYYPHMIYNNVLIREGQVLIGEASAYVGGYSAELERTMIVGRPSEKQMKYFNIMMRAREAALKEYKPGNPCYSPNKAAFKVFREEGVLEMVLHRTGHGIGLEGHEPPWIEDGDSTEMKPGMVFSCEPGIYVPGLGGFRHSDTVVITEDGAEIITNYPVEIGELLIS